MTKKQSNSDTRREVIMDKWNQSGGLTLFINLLTILLGYGVGGAITLWFQPTNLVVMLVAIHISAAVIFLGTILLRIKMNWV